MNDAEVHLQLKAKQLVYKKFYGNERFIFHLIKYR